MQKKITHSLKLIADALEKYNNKVAVAASFGKDSVVTVHLARQIRPNIPVIFLNTHYKFQETIHYKDYITDLWQLNLKEYSAPLLGMDLWKTDTKKCCQYYKVDVLGRAIQELKLDAWVSGMRATEGETRREVPEIQKDKGLIKINPILEFAEIDIWKYHALYNIPIHPLYLQGYRSIGCEPCTKKGGKLERDGRWAGTSRQGGECQIHTVGLRSGKTY